MKRPQCKDHHLINDDLIMFCNDCRIFLKKDNLESKPMPEGPRYQVRMIVKCPHCYSNAVYHVKENDQYELSPSAFWDCNDLEEAHHCSICKELGTEFLEIPIIGKLCKLCYEKYGETNGYGKENKDHE